MDFFAQQDRARRQTGVMVALFLLSVLVIVVTINLTGAVIYIITFSVPLHSIGSALYAVPHQAYWITTAVVLGVIGWGTLTRLYELSGGGAAVAQMVGARWIRRDTTDAAERRLLNVVEEMAIAAGITVPQVYVMDDETGINAFAAGYSPNEAAITVTRATIDLLSRDELQGVIAHEFSHILNGDMRLNIRLIGVIAGIVMIGGIGQFMMRAGSGGRDADLDTVTISASDKRSHGDIRLFVAGLVIWLIGLIGVLFGNLIKAAISRQREFLADASAVQFTRNADGIGGALIRIAQSGSMVGRRYSEELSHMFFCSAIDGLFATHPPISERIERVLGPGAMALATARTRRKEPSAASTPAALPEGVSALNAESARNDTAAASIPWDRGTSLVAALQPAAALASAGQLSNADVGMARSVLAALPPTVREATGTTSGACAALCALLLDADDQAAARTAQVARITAAWGQAESQRIAALAAALQPMGIRARLPVFALSVPALQPLGQAQRDTLLAVLRDLANVDGRVTLGEFVLLTLCSRHLAKPVRGVPPVKYRRPQDAAGPAATVLQLVARASNAAPDALEKVFDSLALQAPPQGSTAALSIAAVEAALYELKLLAPLAKPPLIKACMGLVLADGAAGIEEIELMRALCAALDTPLPPSLGNDDILAGLPQAA